MHDVPLFEAGSATLPSAFIYPQTHPFASASALADFLYSIAYLPNVVVLLYNSFTINEPSAKLVPEIILPELSKLAAAIVLYRVLKKGCGCPLPELLFNNVGVFLNHVKPVDTLANSSIS